MINGAEVMGRVQAGQVPDSWRVLRANKSHFVKSLLGYLILVLLVIAGVLYLIATPNIAFTYLRGGGGLTESELSTWRTIDFVVLAIAFAGFAYACYTALKGLGTVEYQAMVLMPEGVVVYKGEKEPQAIDFSTVTNIRSVRQRGGDITLYLRNAMTGKEEQVALDARFGKPAQLASGITSGYQHYQTTRAANPGYQQ